MDDEDFWDWWINRFNNNIDTYITPNQSEVQNQANKLDYNGKTLEEKGLLAWAHTRNIVEYKLSKEWKEPIESIKEGKGDCEDMCFLLVSMLGNMDADKGEIHVGDLIRGKADRGLHVWCEVDGRIMDPTGVPNSLVGMKYKPVHKFQFEFVKCESCKEKKEVEL